MAKTTQQQSTTVPRVAIIGAGLSGMVAARTLADHGLAVTVFEKSRGVGGRMSTRRIDGGVTFDHGAQYFTARNQQFITSVDSWIEHGVVAKWPDLELGDCQKIVVIENGVVRSESASQQRFVAVPAMNSVCKHLARDLQIHMETRVAKVLPDAESRIELFDDDRKPLGTFDRLIVSAPAAQSAKLLSEFPELAKQISQIEMNPCWATMVSVAKPITEQWVGAFLHKSFLSWAARNSTKPGRNDEAEHFVIHANPEWTAENWERDAHAVAKAMLAELWKVTGATPQPCLHLQAHRWKYAIAVEPAEVRWFANASATVCCCGDWASGSRVEGAFLSGTAAAEKVLATIEI